MNKHVSKKTGILALLMAFVIAFSPIGTNFSPLGNIEVEAATVKYKTTDSLNMRSGASTKYKVLVTIPKGKEVTYVSKSGTWFKVKYGSKTGYVSSKYLKKVTAAPKTKETKFTTKKYTTTASLNVRSTYSTKGKIVTKIPKGKTISSNTKVGTWYKVTYNKKTGWVSGSYLKEVKPKPAPKPKETKFATKKYTTTAKLSVRSSASTKGKVLTSIPKGKTVSSSSKIGSWYKVTYNKKTGWVSGSYLKEVKPAPKPKETKFTTKKYSTTANLSVRSTYSTSGKVLITIPKGKVVSSNTKVGTWYKVSYGSKTGWVSGSYLKEVVVKPTTPTKQVFLTTAAADKHLMNADSTINKNMSLFSKIKLGTYYGTLEKTDNEGFNARSKVVDLYAADHMTVIKIDKGRYLNAPEKRAEGDKIFLVASQAFFGSGTLGSNELYNYIKQNLNNKDTFNKKVTIAGHTAEVFADSTYLSIYFE